MLVMVAATAVDHKVLDTNLLAAELADIPATEVKAELETLAAKMELPVPEAVAAVAAHQDMVVTEAPEVEVLVYLVKGLVAQVAQKLQQTAMLPQVAVDLEEVMAIHTEMVLLIHLQVILLQLIKWADLMAAAAVLENFM
jgi:hypothetical protein